MQKKNSFNYCAQQTLFMRCFRKTLHRAYSKSAVNFPCVEKNSALLRQGPEPNYQKVVSGYKVFHHQQPFVLDWGGVLPEFQLAYETWGQLNSDRSNAILLHTGLSASSHAKSHRENPDPGWWEDFIGNH